MLLAWQILTLFLLLGLWSLVWALELLPPTLVPPPWDVGRDLFVLAATATFWASLWATLYSALVGLVLAVVIGIPLGLLLGMMPAAYRATQLVIDFARSFPSIALLPVLVLVIGANHEMKVTVIVLAVMWPVLLQTYDGARRVDPVVFDTVRAYRIPPVLRFFKVVLPNAAPFVATGIRIAASAAILIALGVEVLTLTPGMGGQLSRAQTDGAPALAIAYLVTSGLVGWTIYRMLISVEHRLLAWSRRAEVRHS